LLYPQPSKQPLKKKKNMPVIPVETSSKSQFVDITHKVAAEIPDGFNGGCLIASQHTTAGLTVNENADPDVVRDMLMQLDEMVPWNHPRFRHMEGNSAAHVKTSLMGSSLVLPVQNGRLVLGTWQSVYFCEFDGPRRRRVVVQLLAEAEVTA
jgi:secondary thiamine-phosphate synthase enzyme